MKKILVLFLSILVFLTACVQGGPAPLESGDLIKTGVAETMDVQDDPIPAPSLEVEGETHSCFPVHPGRQALPLPVGFMAGIKPTAVRFYDSTGLILGEKQTPNLYSLYGNRLHPAGGITNGISGVPLIYHVRESEDFVKANIDANIFQMDRAPEIVVITGAEGKFTLVVYSSAEYTDDGLITTLKIAEMGELVVTSPQLTRVGEDQLVYYPLSVHVENDQAQGIWFTFLKHRMSDFNFLPLNGIYYFDLIKNTVTEFLGVDSWIKGFSPDQTLVVFGPTPGGNSSADEYSLSVLDLEDCQEWVIPYHESSILGAGKAVLSPDGQTIAWVEASGFMLEDQQYRLRVASLLDPAVLLVDSPANELTGLVGGEEITYLIPAGWISDHVLLLEVGVLGVDFPLIVAYAPDPGNPLDPALGANQSVPLGEGVFSGLLYP